MYICIYVHVCVICLASLDPKRHTQAPMGTCGVAMVSRIDKIIGLFCKRAL